MTRILFWLALVFLVMGAIRTKLRNASGNQQPSPRQPSAPPRQADAEAMLRCAHCGVHYPASENVLYKGQDFCSLAHAQLAAN
ncbi:PP0621 family protein [Pseudoduganella sp. RAF53_2]|uniref:PP0621 family protein n=1 Tax=unclassified Pseudoduganella TaxID=2637179 RepID=UPI003F987C39